MPFLGDPIGLWKAAEIFFIDLALGADNAIVIALASRALPPHLARRAVILGVLGAIFFRLLITTIAGSLLDIPFLRLIAAVFLVIIAIRLSMDNDGPEETAPAGGAEVPAASPSQFVSAVFIIIMADAIMSLDNIVALAAIARGDVAILALGLAVSLPVLAYGGLLFSQILAGYPVLVLLGAAVLGYVAGDMAAGDASISGWIKSQAPALRLALPWLCAIFVLAEAGLPSEKRRSAAADYRRNAARALQSALSVPSGSKTGSLAAPSRAVAAVARQAAPQAASTDQTGNEKPASTASKSEDRAVLIGFLALSAIFALILLVALIFGDGLQGN